MSPAAVEVDSELGARRRPSRAFTAGPRRGKRVKSGRLGWLGHYLRRRKLAIVAALTAVVGWTGTLVAAPLIQRIVVDDAIVEGSQPMAPWVIGLATVGVLRGTLGGCWRAVGGRVSLAVVTDVRDDLYAQLQRLDVAAHERIGSGQLLSRVNSDLLLVQQLLGMLVPVLGTVLQILGALTIMFVLSPPLAGMLLVVVTGLIVIARRLSVPVYAASWNAQQREADMTTVAEEAVTGVRVVKAFGQEKHELARFLESLTQLFSARVGAIRSRAPLLAMLQGSPLIGQVLVLLLGGWLALNGHVTIGTFFAFLAYLTDLNGSARLLAGVLTHLPRARSGAERLAEIFAVKPGVQSTPATTIEPDPPEPQRSRGTSLRFENVSLAYGHDTPALDGFSLEVHPGETVAIVGPTGSGKSTVVQLVPRLRDVTAGRVTLDGVDVRELPLPELRRRVSVAFDESMLLSGSLRENIAYGRPDATDDAIERVARIVAVHDFVVGLPEGYDTDVGQEGLSLSGGQRQRIALARALLADADVLVLDDATSAVDVHVEQRILDAMREELRARTVIMVAYRESTVQLADRVVVVDRGRAVAQGTHRDLLERSALYRSLMTQLDDEADSESSPVGITPDAWQPAAHVSGEVRARVGDPATPELLNALATLPAVHDEPRVDVDNESTRRDDFRAWQIIEPQKAAIAFGLGLLLIDVGATLSGPLLVQAGVQQATDSRSMPMLALVCGVFTVTAVTAVGIVWLAHLVTQRTAERILHALRVRLFAHLQRLSMDYYDRTHTGRIMTRLTSDVNAVAEFAQAGLTNALVAITTFAGMTTVLLVLQPTLALVVLAVIPLAAVATVLYRRAVRPQYEFARQFNSALTSYLHETLAVLPVTQVFRREQANMEHFRELARNQLRAQLSALRATAMFVGFIEMLGMLTIAATLIVGHWLVSAGRIEPVGLVPFLLYVTLAFAPIQQLAMVFDIYQRARVGLERIAETLGEHVNVPTPQNPAPLGRLGDVRLNDVTLQYPGTREPAVRDVNLHIGAGERVAFVGETGAGKSTIAKLITRFYDPTAGQVRVDGTPIERFDVRSYRQSIGYVPQEPFLFSRTIRDNIAYGAPQTADEFVEAAARAVGAHEFVASLDGGYLHEVTERGRSLSAGQRQLLCLARALLLDPRVLVLDEATSHLDLQSERRVEHAMRKAAAGRTTIVIAHRPQTLRWVDRVVTIHDGRVVSDVPQQLAAVVAYVRRHGTPQVKRSQDSEFER